MFTHANTFFPNPCECVYSRKRTPLPKVHSRKLASASFPRVFRALVFIFVRVVLFSVIVRIRWLNVALLGYVDLLDPGALVDVNCIRVWRLHGIQRDATDTPDRRWRRRVAVGHLVVRRLRGDGVAHRVRAFV